MTPTTPPAWTCLAKRQEKYARGVYFFYKEVILNVYKNRT